MMDGIDLFILVVVQLSAKKGDLYHNLRPLAGRFFFFLFFFPANRLRFDPRPMWRLFCGNRLSTGYFVEGGRARGMWPLTARLPSPGNLQVAVTPSTPQLLQQSTPRTPLSMCAIGFYEGLGTTPSNNSRALFCETWSRPAGVSATVSPSQALPCCRPSMGMFETRKRFFDRSADVEVSARFFPILSGAARHAH